MIDFDDQEKDQYKDRRDHYINRLDEHHWRMNPDNQVTDHSTADSRCDPQYQNPQQIQSFLYGNHGTGKRKCNCPYHFQNKSQVDRSRHKKSSSYLFCTENTVTCISKSRADICIFI